jgi:sugar phosphate isomerase/epimerase
LHTRLRTGISSGHFDWQTLEEAFRRCRNDWGFDVLEIWSEQIGYPPDRKVCADVKVLAEKHEIAIGYHAPLFGEYDLARHGASQGGLIIRELLQVCNRMRVEFLTIHLGTNPDRQAGLRSAMSAISQNGLQIEKQRVKIAIECVPTVWGNQVGDRVEDFELIFRALDHPWLGLNLDFGHAQLNRNLDQFIARVGDRIIYCHIHDNRGDIDEHLGYGMGTIDWTRSLRALLSTGFRGPFVIEYPEMHGADKTARFLADLRTHCISCDALNGGPP